MNKLFATIALAALAFTSCIKENNTWKEMRPVQPGMYIYEMTTNQDKLAMRPANAALRLRYCWPKRRSRARMSCPQT